MVSAIINIKLLNRGIHQLQLYKYQDKVSISISCTDSLNKISQSGVCLLLLLTSYTTKIEPANA